jgi:hypothetical protein
MYMFLGPTASKSNSTFLASAGVSTKAPFSQWRAGAVISRMLISGIEIGGEMLAVIAAVAVENVELADGLELVLLEPHGEDRCDAGIEARSQQRHNPGLLETVVIGPLPFVLELGLVFGLVIGGVEIMHAGLETGVHDRQVLIGQRQIDDQAGLHLADQIDHRRDFLGVDLVGGDVLAGALLDALGDGIAFRLGAAGEMDVRENLGVHRHFVHAYRTDAARADDQDCRHNNSIACPTGALAGPIRDACSHREMR